MIAIVDYGVGNLRSVQKALEYVGLDAIISSNPQEVRSASHIILPGVGAFSNAMKNLVKSEMIGVLKESIAKNKPFLGICLGMQLLFERSHEGTITKGLGILPGEIINIPKNMNLKVPHMGWNKLLISESPLWKDIQENSYVYFVHSYHVTTTSKEIIIGSTHYGIEFPVAVEKGNIFGVQFHPEKSGDIGLQILQNFGGLK